VLPEGGENQSPTFGGKLDPADSTITGLFFSDDETLSNKAVDGDTDGTGSQPDFGSDGVDGEGPLVEEGFQHSEIGIAEAGSGDAFLGVRQKGVESLHQDEPDVNAGHIVLAGGNFFDGHIGDGLSLTKVILMSI